MSVHERLLSSKQVPGNEDDHGDEPRVCCGPTVRFFNILVMSVGFMTLFVAYNTVQNYVTTLLGALGMDDGQSRKKENCYF